LYRKFPGRALKASLNKGGGIMKKDNSRMRNISSSCHGWLHMKQILIPIWMMVCMFMPSYCYAGDNICQAIEKHDPAGVRALLNKGVDLHARNCGTGYTPLYWACLVGRPNYQGAFMEVVKLLLDKGAPDKNEALFFAIDQGSLALVKVLIDKGANVNARSPFSETSGLAPVTPLMYPPPTHEILKLLIDKGADVKAKDANGATVLMHVLSTCRVDDVKLLIEKGADVNAKSNDGSTILMAAINNVRLSCQGHLDIIRLLFDKEKNLDVNAKTNDGITALIIAAMAGNPDVVKLLLERGKKIDVNAKASSGLTAMNYAKMTDNKEIIQLLRKAGAKE
jgi:ankyrin repeat protein